MRKYLILPIAAVLLLLLCGCSEHRKSYEEGQLALQEERYDEAIRRFELAVSQGMKEPVVYADLAIACEKAGRAGDAEAYAAQAKEQGEEEMNADDMIKKYELFGSDPRGLYSLNQELAGRVYSAPSLVL